MSDTPRPVVTIGEHFPGAYRAMLGLEQTVKRAVEPTLYELIKLRASQINGCAYCLDMHAKDALAAGERIERITLLPAWRETTLFDARERAALALTEAITTIADQHVPIEVEAHARAVFDEAEYAAVVWAAIVINSWNRLAITGHSEPGHYQPGDHG